METNKFPSNILNKNIEYKILSASELADEVYLLYVQDGKDYHKIGDIEKTYQHLITTFPDLTQKLVIVLVHPGDSMERWNSYHHEGKLFDNYIQFMYREFIPMVERNLPKISKRGLLGDSLAANISLHIAAREPTYWTHLLLQSAAIAPYYLSVLANVEEKIPWNVYQTVGLHEDQFISSITNEQLYILSRNRKLHHALMEKGARVLYSEQDESHEWVFWKKDLRKALRFFVE